MRKLLFLMCMCLCVTFAQAQTRQVTGVIRDDNGKPVAGATVSVKGSKTSAVTKEDGSFSITVPDNAKLLQVNFIGYKTEEVVLGSHFTGNVQLTASNKLLDEVVVVGYGSKSTRELTGSVSKVAGDKIANEPVTSFNQALSGKTAGVQVNMSSGTPGDRTSIRVRGINSITSSSQPLIVIDGIAQVDNVNLNSFNSGNGTRFDPLALVNPNDIESIEVLKDAGAAVIYGSRASNGVILITTKKGKRGNVKVNAESKFGFSSARKLPSLLNVDEFTTISNEKVANRYGTDASTGYPVARPSDINGDDKEDRTDWLKEIYRTGNTYDNSVSFSGGADKIAVFGSARYLKQEGIIIGNQIKTGQGRLNMEITPKTWFKSGLQLSYTKTLNNGVLTDGYIAGASISGWAAPPNVSAYDPNGPLGFNISNRGLLSLGNNVTSITVPNTISILPSASYYVNVPAAIKSGRNDNTAQDIRANIYGELQPIKGLRVTTKFGIQSLSNFEDQYTAPYISGLGLTYNGLVQDQNRNFNQWVWQNYASYDQTFANVHKVGAVAGIENQYNKYNELFTGAANLTDPFFTHIINGAYTNTQPGSTTVLDNTGGDLYSYGLISYFGRLNYSYAGKYMIEASFRRDGYSAFATDHRFGNFPSVSAGWEITKEAFMQNIKWLNFLKLRGSYGQVGNSGGIKAYAARTLFGGRSYTSLNGLAITQAGNPNLQWETAKKTDVGIDAGFFKGRLTATVEYFNNNIDHLLLQAPVLYTVGIPGASIFSNIGAMTNKGIEVTINATPVSTKDFVWNTSFNFTSLKNRVNALVPSNNNADITGAFNYTVAHVGSALGEFYLPRWAGVDANTGNATWYAKDNSIKMWDFASQSWTDGKGGKVSGLGINDYVYTGKSGLPKFYGGWDNSVSYKNFDLGVSITYSGGNYVYNATRAGMLTNFFSNNFTDVLNRWQKPGDKTDIARLYANDNTAYSASTLFLEKGDYIRVRTITLGYTLPKIWMDKIGFDKVRVYAQAFNPFLITGYKGLDPDVNYQNANVSNISLSVDNRATPQAKTFTVGLSFGF
ncbi:SusC/RagA family TonB-linked outer membrane protein [Deminuibacter soli]|uniref:TonB-dependent receptor n=1 Tax=Deminuibacter soli TaxID=2291815 RepID=A0A3E1NPZ8_9BACT|nr:TonB-dependent receptor [Deminuibacter soli]RFM29894.1 TonB-dependent receptor [Deminuibacter soli]